MGKTMDKISEYSNIFYDEGMEEGFEEGLEQGLKEGRVEGRKEGRKEVREELLAKAKAASPELYGKLCVLIYGSVPTPE